ncbi:hypothetical protein Z945_1627 [Sulfitobacter noctilucae]|nr:hypothetical protein Z945_1627 [Sulfitobacter noctilucae]
MVHSGDDEAPSFGTSKSFLLEVYNLEMGPIIGAIESEERVCVIRPEDLQRKNLRHEVAA